MTNIRKRIPHVIGASVLAVTLTGTVGAITAMGADTAPTKAATQTSSQAPDVRCLSFHFDKQTGKLVKFPPNCTLRRLGGGTTGATTTGATIGGRTGGSTTGATTTGATTTTTGASSTTGATTTGATTTTTGASSTTGATTTGATTGGGGGTTGATSTGATTG
ncbi:hypothetical protein, partial [Streptomyces sp. NPDC054786]